MSDYADSLITAILDYWKPKRIYQIELQGYIESKELLPTYQEYINSPEWKEKSKEAKERAGYRCQLCNRKGNDTTLHVHHNTYDRLLLEDNNDLIVLCSKCHAKFHDVEIQEDNDDLQNSGIKF
jgi:hypothetical protein